MSSVSDSDGNESESDDSDASDTQIVVKIQKQNNCDLCGGACVILTTSQHHLLSMKELSLWAKLIVCSLLLSHRNHLF